MAPPMSAASGKRGPSVLVTDAREQHPAARSRPPPLLLRNSSRFVTVDSVLQYASDIPSMQQRQPAQRTPLVRTQSGRPADPRLAGRPVLPQHMPARSTKVSEKLVLLPDTGDADDEEVEEKADYDEDNDEAPTRDNEEVLRRTRGKKGKSYAERLPKARRAEKLARVTAYCTAQACKMKGTAQFLKDQHGARTKLYDDCLYTVYHLPLLPGTEGYRVKSSPLLKSSGGKTLLDEEIERNEGRDYGEGFFEAENAETFSVRGNEEDESNTPTETNHTSHRHSETPDDHDGRRESTGSARSMSPTRVSPDAFTFAEMFVFSYGVVVFWNFTERQEKDVLADLTFSESETGVTLVTGPQDEEDFETEEFHFEYSPETPRPRVFNDMITLRSGDHMIKLAMSHAIAQSTKLNFFEQRMADQMAEAQHVPRRLALTGKLGMKREEVVRILGALFRSRVDVNLSSNMLDVPNFFWDSEPTLHPLYFAVREYLEIKPRVQALNERCRVFLDLAEILSDSIADDRSSRLTWIIIVLILISIAVTCSEVFLRFGILSSSTRGGKGAMMAKGYWMWMPVPPVTGGGGGGAALGLQIP
ncbi:MAG: hypothetical protein Q9221_008710 [Calogaya cf. arnoldii]